MPLSTEPARKNFEHIIHQFAELAVFVTDTDGIIKYWNQEAEKVYGYTSADIVDKHISLLCRSADEASVFTQQLKDTEKTNSSTVQEHWRVKKDTTLLFAQIIVSPLLADNKLVGFTIITKDITERQMIERNLRFLSEASKILSSSLDYKKTLKNIVKIAVPDIADWCSISLLEGDELVPVTVAHKDPEKIKWAEKINKKYKPD